MDFGLADDAVGALAEAAKAMESSHFPAGTAVLAAGIDAPMFWSPNGFRNVDQILLRVLEALNIENRSGTVQQLNSLRGAALVQGVLLGWHLRNTWDLQITESHPKVLDHLLMHYEHHETLALVDDLAENIHDPERHIRDAILSAVTAWAMVYKLPRWRNIFQDEPNPLQPFDTPVSYWMPVPSTFALL